MSIIKYNIEKAELISLSSSKLLNVYMSVVHTECSNNGVLECTMIIYR